MFQLAVYGKGGIGKSTSSANISMALTEKGFKVMQIGCDPKHDSTRLLLNGNIQNTVLDYMRETPIAKRKLEDIVFTGTNGILCTEAGGPEPGVGCAGRGILTTFDILKKLGADDLDVNVRLYDVLGDVVCGGFAVPMRDGYADAVILVTSGEFMALYAANNIMKGMLNFDTGKPRLLGIVLNCRGVENEEETVTKFANATGTKILAKIPRDKLFADAESQGHTVMELYPDSDISEQFRKIADMIAIASQTGEGLVNPKPLDDDQLEDLAAGRTIRPPSGISPRMVCGCKRSSINDTRIMSSCAAFGAVAAFSRLRDTAVIIHGPMSCAYLMCTMHTKAVVELYAKGLYEGGPEYNIRSTCMDDSAAIFGGDAFLRKYIQDAIDEGFRNIAIVTTCMPGIIGDDCQTVIDSFRVRYRDICFHLVQTDGDIAGEYNDGFQMATDEISRHIDTRIQPEDGFVNLIGSSFFDIQSHKRSRELDEILDVFGLKVNCRYIDMSSPAHPRELCRGITDIMMNESRSTKELMDGITINTGRKPFPVTMPIGLREYLNFLDEMGKFTGKTDVAEREKIRAESEYREFIASRRPRFEGKKAIVIWRFNSPVDWLMDLLNDLGIEIVRVGVNKDARKREGEFTSRYSTIVGYTNEQMRSDLAEFKPELLICELLVDTPEGTAFAKINRIGVGIHAQFDYVDYLENVLRLPAKEGWKCL